MSDALFGLAALEELNPVPEPRGNPGPAAARPVADVLGDAGTTGDPGPGLSRPPRRVMAGAAVGLLAVLAAWGVTMGPDGRDDVDLTVSPPEPAQQDDPPGVAAATAGSTEPRSIARIVVPAIDLDQIVVEGIDIATLRQGPGHDPASAFPGQRGNAVIAGTRTTYGAPFHRLDELEPGDVIEVTTPQGRFDYEVAETLILEPDATAITRDLGDDRLTLTTEHPKYSARQRLVVIAHLLDDPAVALPLHLFGTEPTPSGWTVATRVPWQVEPVAGHEDRAGGFIGVVHDVEQGEDSNPAALFGTLDVAHRVVVSDEGRWWRVVDHLAPLEAHWIRAFEREGEIHVVGLRAAEETGRRELFHLAGPLTDGFPRRSWVTVATEPLPHDWPERTIGFDAVAGEAGVLVWLSGVAWGGALELSDEIARSGAGEICEFASYENGRLTYRRCGQTESVTVDQPADRSQDREWRWSSRVVFAPWQGTFDNVELEDLAVALAEGEDDDGGDPPGGGFDGFHGVHALDGDLAVSVEQGIGRSGPAVFRTSDGERWIAVATPGAPGPMLAVHGDALVYSTFMGPLVWGGEEPTMIRRGEMFEGRTNSILHVAAGEAGVVVVGQVKVQPEQAAGLDRQYGFGSESEFTLESEGYVLAGTAPYGPATLSDANGAVVRHWSHLEVARPAWNGLVVTADEVVVLDDDNRRIVGFPAASWDVLASPSDSFGYEVAFSVDGTRWTTLAADLGFVADITVGVDEVLITHAPRSASLDGPLPRLFTTIVPVSPAPG